MKSNAPYWDAEDKLKLSQEAKRIYAEGIIAGTRVSKLRCFQEAVLTLPPEKQKPIPRLQNIAYWTNKPEHWPNDTEPHDVIDALRAEQAAAEKDRMKIDWSTAPVEPVTNTVVVSEPAKEAEVLDVSSLFKTDEEVAAERAVHAAEHAAEVPVTVKHRKLHEAPEAQLGKILLDMVHERYDSTIDKRISAVLDSKAQAFIEAAVEHKLREFESSMLALVSSLESSVTAALDAFLCKVDERLAGLHTSQHTTHHEAQDAPDNSTRSATDDAQPLWKPTILIAGVHHNIRDAVLREYNGRANLTIWVGPNADRRNVGALMDTPGLDGVLVGPTNGGLEIIKSLKERPNLPYRKIQGSYSMIRVALEDIIRTGSF